MSKLLRTPPNQFSPSRSESDIQKLYTEEVCIANITQRSKRRCPSSENSTEDSDLRSEIKEMIQNMMTLQNSRLDRLENHMLQIKSLNTKIEETGKEIEKSMTYVTEQLASLEVKISSLEKERNTMAKNINALEEKLESFDRSFVKTSIELHNVPKRSNESKQMLFDAILELSKHLQINIGVSDIRDVSRQPSKKENPNSVVAVEFINTLSKTNFLMAAKEHNKRNPSNKLSSINLGIQGTKTPVYITEQLTTYSKRLFYLTRSFAKTKNYMYCWTSNGRIMLRKGPDAQAIHIKTELQLAQLSESNNA